MRVEKPNRKTLARRRRHAISNVRRLWEGGLLHPSELRRLIGDIVHRYQL